MFRVTSGAGLWLFRVAAAQAGGGRLERLGHALQLLHRGHAQGGRLQGAWWQLQRIDDWLSLVVSLQEILSAIGRLEKKHKEHIKARTITCTRRTNTLLARSSRRRCMGRATKSG
jgi:hypothetical protein